MIPYGRQNITDEDVDAVVKVLRSDFLTQGPAVGKFESAVAEKVGANYAVAANSATSALHIACMALDLGPNDWLWTSPITFVASANCALYCGANIDFVDVEADTGNMCVVALEGKLQKAQVNGRLPKVVVPVHLSGQPCDMENISRLAKIYGFSVVEDASHAIGGKYHAEYVGSCRYSDITIFSFHPVKIITTAEGGLALTNDARLSDKMRRFSSHGITRDSNEMVGEPDGPWYYQQIDLGYNYRMTDIQAALGLSQLGRLDQYVKTRHAIVARYEEMLSDFPIALPVRRSGRYSALHLYAVLVPDPTSRWTIFQSMREAGVGVNVHYIPVHTQPYYRQLGFNLGDFPKAEEYYARTISLPIYPTLTQSEQDNVVSALKRAIAR